LALILFTLYILSVSYKSNIPGEKVTSELGLGADVVVNPQVSASGVNLGVPGAELGKSGFCSEFNGLTAVTRPDLVIGLAGAHDARHLGI
jgi:hypothetical protein